MEFIPISLEGNEDELIALFRSCYADTPDRVPTSDELHWRYGGSLFSCSLWAAIENGKIVGLRPLVIRPLQIGDSADPALHLMDAVVHPDYQGQGVFRSLMNAVWQHHANDGVVAFTFPNSMSLKAYRRWKSWVEVSSMRLWVCIVPPRNRSDAKWLPRFTGGYASIMTRHITQALVGLPPRSGIDIMQIEDFDAAMGQLWTENSESCSFAVPRKLEYLRWRYRDRPSVNYQLYRAESSGRCVGFLVTRKREMFGLQLGLLVDFLVQGHQPSILSALIESSVSDLINEGVDAIGALYVGPARLWTAFYVNGFIPIPKFLVEREFVLYMRPTGLLTNSTSITGRRRQYLTWGDNDAV